MTVASPPKSPSPPKATKDPRQAALSRALLTSVATNNISTLQQGLAKQTTYWSGVAWVAGALAQRIEGIGAQDVDLVNVTEKLGSYVSLPDAGSLPRGSGGRDHGDGNVLGDAGITPRTWNALVNGGGGESNGFGASLSVSQVCSSNPFLQARWTSCHCPSTWGPLRVYRMSPSKMFRYSHSERSGSVERPEHTEALRLVGAV